MRGLPEVQTEWFVLVDHLLWKKLVSFKLIIFLRTFFAILEIVKGGQFPLKLNFVF